MMTLFVCLYLSPFNLTLQQKTGTHDTLGGLAVGTVQDQEDDTIKVQGLAAHRRGMLGDCKRFFGDFIWHVSIM